MNLLKNIPSSELNNVIHRQSLVSEPPPHSPMNDQFSNIPRHTRSYANISSSISSTKSLITNPPSSSPSIHSNLPISTSSTTNSCNTMTINDIPSYQHSLHSFLKRQLSAPSNDIDKDVIEIDLNSEIPAVYPFHHHHHIVMNDSQQQQQQNVNALYPALLLDNMDHQQQQQHQHTDFNSRVDIMFRKLSYMKNLNIGQTSAPEHKYEYETNDYFNIPLDNDNSKKYKIYLIL